MLQHLLALFKGIYAHEDNIAFSVFGNIDRLLTLMCKLRDRIIVISKGPVEDLIFIAITSTNYAIII